MTVTEALAVERVTEAGDAWMVEGRLQIVMAEAVDPVLLVDEAGRLLYHSPSLERMLGYQWRAEDESESIFPYVHPADLDDVGDAFARAASLPGRHGPVRFRVRRADGEWCVCEASAVNLLDDATVEAVVIVLRDLTRQLSTEAALRRSRAQQAAVAELGSRAMAGLPVATVMAQTMDVIADHLDVEYVAMLERDGDQLVPRAVRGWNDVRARGPVLVTPGGQPELTLRTLEPVVSPDLLDESRFAPGKLSSIIGARSSIMVPLEVNSQVFGLLAVHSTEVRAFNDDDASFLRAAGNVCAAAISAVRTRDRHRYEVLHDSLTGVANRVLLEDRIALATRRSEVADGSPHLVLVDLDDFRDVNERIGHIAGDAVLRSCAGRLEALVPPGATLGRLDADTFAVVLDDGDDPAAFARSARRALAEPFVAGGERITPSARAGIVRVRSHRDDPIAAGLAALRRAKRSDAGPS